MVSCIDSHVWIFMSAHRINWNTLSCDRLKYRWNRQLSFLRDRPTCLNLYGCSQNKLKYFTMSSFEISMKSTAFITARQTDKSGWNTLPCHRCLKYRWNRQLSFLRDRPTSLDLSGCVMNKLKHVIVSNSDVYPDSEWIQSKQADFNKTDLPTLWLHSRADDNLALRSAITFSLGLGQRADRPTHFCQLNKQDHSIRKDPSDRPATYFPSHYFRVDSHPFDRDIWRREIHRLETNHRLHIPTIVIRNYFTPYHVLYAVSYAYYCENNRDRVS